MTVVNLAWYTSVMLVLGVIMCSCITVAAGAEPFFHAAQIVLVGGVAAMTTIALLLSRKPSSHWTRTSKPLQTMFVAIATLATLTVAMVG